jgi:hypothetical protein
VRKQTLPLRRMRRVLAGGEHHMRFRGISLGVDRYRCRVRDAVVVDPDPAEVVSEARLEIGADRASERLPRGAEGAYSAASSRSLARFVRSIWASSSSAHSSHLRLSWEGGLPIGGSAVGASVI